MDASGTGASAGRERGADSRLKRCGPAGGGGRRVGRDASLGLRGLASLHALDSGATLRRGRLCTSLRPPVALLLRPAVPGARLACGRLRLPARLLVVGLLGEPFAPRGRRAAALLPGPALRELPGQSRSARGRPLVLPGLRHPDVRDIRCLSCGRNHRQTRRHLLWASKVERRSGSMTAARGPVCHPHPHDAGEQHLQAAWPRPTPKRPPALPLPGRARARPAATLGDLARKQRVSARHRTSTAGTISGPKRMILAQTGLSCRAYSVIILLEEAGVPDGGRRRQSVGGDP